MFTSRFLSLTPTPHYKRNTNELKVTYIERKIAHKDGEDSEYKIFKSLLHQKSVRLLSKKVPAKKQDVIRKNNVVFRCVKILHCWHLVFIRVSRFKVQTVSAIAGIWEALGDVVLRREQGEITLALGKQSPF